MEPKKIEAAVSNFIKTDWQFSLPDTGYELVSVLSANGFIYVASNGYVFQLNQELGTLIHQNPLTGMEKHEVRMAISKTNDKLIVGTYGNVFALDANDISKTLWRNPLKGQDTGIVSLIVGSENVFAGTGGFVNSLQLSDGTTIGKNSLSGMGTAEVRLALSLDETTLAVGLSGNVICLDASNINKVISSNSLSGQGQEVVNLIIQDNVIYAGTNGFVNAIDIKSGQILQTNDLKGLGHLEVRLCLSADGTTIYGGTNGKIVSMDVQNLENSKWISTLQDADGNVVSMVTDYDGFIYGGSSGRISQLEPVEGKIVNTNNLPGRGVNEVRLSLGQNQVNLYIGTNGYAIGTSELGAATLNKNNWMEAIGAIIKDMQVKDMLIPGTHDSGSYGINANSAFSPETDLPEWVKKIRNSINPLYLTMGEVVASWAKAQGQTALAQLIGGVRYLDLRLSLNPNDKEPIWISHSLYSVPLTAVISAVNSFITNNPKEIVILDLNHFYDLDNFHDQIVSLLSQAFGNKMAIASLGSDVTVSQLWEAGQQLLVFYANDATCEKYPFLWKEKNLDSPGYSPTSSEELLADLNTNLQKLSGDAFSYIHGQLTPDVNMIKDGLIPFNGKPSSLMGSAEQNNPIFMNWVKQQAYTSKLNIIASDWVFTMDDFISHCILVNKSRATN